MDQVFYTTSQLAQKATVSVRTLRFYDQEELLKPSRLSEKGHRLYTDADLPKLQYIMALRFLGFSLAEIKVCLKAGPKHLQERLEQQRNMVLEKRSQLDRVIAAIEQLQKALPTGGNYQELTANVMKVMQMEQNQAWKMKHLTPEQREQMRELTERSYSPEAIMKLRERAVNQHPDYGLSERYAQFRNDLTKAVAEGAEPGSPQGQTVAKMLREMNDQRSQGDSEIIAGMKKAWDNYNSLPDDQKPLIFKIPEVERDFIKQAMQIYYKKRE